MLSGGTFDRRMAALVERNDVVMKEAGDDGAKSLVWEGWRSIGISTCVGHVMMIALVMPAQVRNGYK